MDTAVKSCEDTLNLYDIRNVKTLFLIRHAKSDHADSTLSDMDRPLSERGHRDAAMMSAIFCAEYPKAHYLVSSPAVRTLATAAYFLKALKKSGMELKLNASIYEAPLGDLIRVVEELDSSRDTAVLFGHNPGFTLLTEYLTETWVDFVTCGVARIQFEVNDWKLCGKGCGKLVAFDYPKQHGL